MEGDVGIRCLFTYRSMISIHTLRMEGDGVQNGHAGGDNIFQSTPSAWRVTGSLFARSRVSRSISIHTLRMEGDNKTSRLLANLIISIHTLRMEGDLQWRRDGQS